MPICLPSSPAATLIAQRRRHAHCRYRHRATAAFAVSFLRSADFRRFGGFCAYRCAPLPHRLDFADCRQLSKRRARRRHFRATPYGDAAPPIAARRCCADADDMYAMPNIAYSCILPMMPPPRRRHAQPLLPPRHCRCRAERPDFLRRCRCYYDARCRAAMPPCRHCADAVTP